MYLPLWYVAILEKPQVEKGKEKEAITKGGVCPGGGTFRSEFAASLGAGNAVKSNSHFECPCGKLNKTIFF